MDYYLRIQHTDESTAYSVFHTFEPLELDIVEGYSRKRHGDSQVVIINFPNEDYFKIFKAACLDHPSVLGMTLITEDEFWKTPSNAI